MVELRAGKRHRRAFLPESGGGAAPLLSISSCHRLARALSPTSESRKINLAGNARALCQRRLCSRDTKSQRAGMRGGEGVKKGQKE